MLISTSPAKSGQGVRFLQLDNELVLIKDKLIDLQQQTSPFKVYIQKELIMLENLLEYYRKSDSATIKKIPGCIFSE